MTFLLEKRGKISKNVIDGGEKVKDKRVVWKSITKDNPLKHRGINKKM